MAAALHAHQRQLLAALDRETDAVHRMEPAVVLGGKGDAQIADVEDSGHAPRGSKASRRASPTRLVARTVRVIAIPGKIPTQGADSRTGRASMIIPPQDGVGGWTPGPRNER